jgi:hypothetical protein
MDERETSPSPTAPADLLWRQLGDGLLRGIGHELNNRIGAVRAVAQVLTADGEPSPLEAALIAETERLQRVADLLRLLPRRAAEPEAVQVADLVPELFALLELHSEWPDIRYRWEVEGEPLPVRVEPSTLLHALGIVMLAAAERADRTHGRTVAVRCRGTERELELEVRVPGEPADGGAESGWRVDAGVAGPLLAELGGTLDAGPPEARGRRVAVSLPTLPELRRRERGARGS